MNCSHLKTEIIPTPELQHHGKIVCADCGKFMGWAKKPQTVEREKRNAVALVRLRNDDRLTAQEREFISSIDGQGPKLSPKQQAWLESLATKYV